MIRNLLFIIFLLLFFPLSTLGAVLYFEPAESEYHQGDTFIVQAKINIKDECINTIEANLTFSQDVLEAVDFSSGDSILTLWINPPSIEQEAGLISFSGGIPGGYCGPLLGDPGESNLLGKIIFQAKEVSGELFSAKAEFLENSQVLLNDGFGTPTKVSFQEAVFTILPGTSEIPKKEWQEELEKDDIPPEIFQIGISQDPSIFEGKYFITFSTTDKQTGVDYYQVKEGRQDWQKTVSPYLLEDQSLESIIKVRAMDKAGNERIAEYRPPREIPLYLIIILVLIGTGLIYWVISRRIMKRP